MSITKYGKPQQQSVPLPVLDDMLPAVIRGMIAALLKHQETIVSTGTVVFTLDASSKVIVKATHTCPSDPVCR